jgi:8-oxo-dGTP pyrophosphatase MutT (NUDIX family)
MATHGRVNHDATDEKRRSGSDDRGRPIIFHQSAGAVVMIDGRCLVLRRADRDEWIFPKGHLEQGESSEDAAIREVREETGLEIEIVEELGSARYTFGRHREQHKRVDWFLGRSVGGALEIEPLFAESAQLDADEAQSVLTHAADREVAARAFALARGLE